MDYYNFTVSKYIVGGVVGIFLALILWIFYPMGIWMFFLPTIFSLLAGKML